MMSLKEFSNGLAKIREGLDMLEIKGRENAAVLCTAMTDAASC